MDKTDRLLKKIHKQERVPELVNPIVSPNMVIPNHSGDVSVRKIFRELVSFLKNIVVEGIVTAGSIISAGSVQANEIIIDHITDPTITFEENSNVRAYFRYANAQDSLQLVSYNGATPIVRMTIDGEGANCRVGIGNNNVNPTAELDVAGNIVVSGTVDGIDIATDVAANTTHRGDNTQAHSDYVLNSEVDTAVGFVLTGDNSSADTAYVPMVLYNTDDTPPAASGFPVGTLYVQYTA